MEKFAAQIAEYRRQIEALQIQSAQELEQFRIQYLGSKGLVKNLMAEMKQVPAEEKRTFGQLLNEFKQFTESKYEEWKAGIQTETAGSYTGIDITLPGNPIPAGGHHPISLMRNRIVEIFQRLGFSVADGPEIEDDWHNFTALNLPADHPARDMQDTFYISTDPVWLLRTHTSNVQIGKWKKGSFPYA